MLSIWHASIWNKVAWNYRKGLKTFQFISNMSFAWATMSEKLKSFFLKIIVFQQIKNRNW